MRRVVVWGAVACAVLGLTACGDDDDDDASTDTAAPAASETTAAGEAASGATTVALAETPLGDVLVDSAGMTLYVFTNDTAGAPTCEGQCADNWPAALVTGGVTAGEGLDAADFSTVAALAGGEQLVVAGQPLYTFAADAAPGDVNGQGVGGVWFAVQADGTAVVAGAAGATETTEAAATSSAGGY